MNFKIELSGIKEFQAALSDLAKTKIPIAVADAMNHTVSGARLAIQDNMDRTFTPKAHPYVKGGIRTQTADKQNLQAAVYISDFASGKAGLSPAEILRPHIVGGGRAVKSSEGSLRKGYSKLFGGSQFITPGPGAVRDSYGNISAQEMVRIKSGAKISEHAPGYLMDITEKSKKRNKKAYGDLFVVPHVGVFRRLGPNSVIPVIYFSSAPTYNKPFDFYGVFGSHVQNNFMKNLLQAWGNAMLKAGRYGK